MPSSEPDSSQELKFPPVRVDHSLTRLDLETLMMRSTERPLPDKIGSSLEDSYELLGDSVFGSEGAVDTSDDEAHTASIASTDGPTPDDTSDDFSDDDSEYDTTERDLQDSTYAPHTEPQEQHPDVQATPSWEDSTLTEVPPHLGGSESSWQISLDEQPSDETHPIQGSKVLKSLVDQTEELPHVYRQYGCAQVRISLKAGLAQHSLQTPDEYTMLVLGTPEKWEEEAVVSKIGEALAASPDASKSVMVRGQVEPYAPVPHVRRGIKISVFPDHKERKHARVLLDDGVVLNFGPGSTTQSGQPDLVVICHPKDTETATDKEQPLTDISEVLAKEGVPCIQLIQVQPYGTRSPQDDSTSLRVCVEGRDDPNTDYELKEVLPLDYSRFSRLEPSQVSRHLALISPHLATPQDTKDGRKARTSWLGDKVEVLTKNNRSQWQWAKVIVSALLMFAMIPALLQGAAYAPTLVQNLSRGRVETSSLSETPELVQTITSIASVSPSVVSNPYHSISVALPPRGLTVVPAQPKTVQRKPKAKDDKIGGFEIQTTGDYQFVLRPSKAFSSGRKKPQLQIQVCRQDEMVPAHYNRTLSGEYIVDLERQYPLSMFNVTIATHSKPLLRQSFEISLGHNKSMLFQLFETARSSIISPQGDLWNASTVAAQHMRTYMSGWESSAVAASERIRDVQHKVQDRLAANVHLARQVPVVTWMGLREATAPVRTSSPMKRARMNALRMRCKMEVAAGLSSKDVKEKQSWACSRVHDGAQG
jgi:hypothetical protein